VVGLAGGRVHLAMGLAGNAARFEGEGFPAPLDFNLLRIKHVVSLNTRGPMPRGPLSRAGSPACSDPLGPSPGPPDCGRRMRRAPPDLPGCACSAGQGPLHTV